LKKGLFFTEASQKVGYGHLMECLSIAVECSRFSDISFYLGDSDKQAVKIVKERGFSEIITGQGDDIDTKISQKFDWLFLNTRGNSYSLQEALIEQTDHFIIFDELGDKRIKCHSLINFSINKQWHKYEYLAKKPRLFFGPEYYPIRKTLHIAKENIIQKTGSLLVTLGGADRTRTTLRLAQILGNLRDLDCTYVIGPGSDLKEEDFHSILRDSSSQRVVKSPSNFDELLASHQFVISAGGNTLYEAVFLGKILLVVWEDEHERIQGECFEQKGLAHIVGGADGLDEALLFRLIAESINHNRAQSIEQSSLVDGMGLERIASIICDL
jgi:spore coat polysaccharide biosynthesis predicted glycosyltransferase SpsG